MPLIQLTNLERRCQTGPTRTCVPRRIDVDINEGDFVTIMRPSGSGKSTFLNVIGMLDGAWTGEYNLLEHPVHNLNQRQRIELNKRCIGFVFQSCHLLDDLTVAEKQLSGGQQQLVAIARAVIASLKLILADEPTGNLHSAQGEEIMRLFKKFNEEGTTIIQVTHSERCASYSHRTINLADGWLA